jgi:hypothetical protein
VGPCFDEGCRQCIAPRDAAVITPAAAIGLMHLLRDVAIRRQTPFQLFAATFTDQSSHQPEDENDQDFRNCSDLGIAGSFSGICPAPGWRRCARCFVGRGSAWAGRRRGRSRCRLYGRTFNCAFLEIEQVSIEGCSRAPNKGCEPRGACRSCWSRSRERIEAQHGSHGRQLTRNRGPRQCEWLRSGHETPAGFHRKGATGSGFGMSDSGDNRRPRFIRAGFRVGRRPIRRYAVGSNRRIGAD